MSPLSTILAIALLCASTTGELYPYNIAPGYFIEVLQPVPIFYESFIPIIFEYSYPKTRNDYLLIPNCEQNDTTCTSLRSLGFFMRTLRADIDFHSSSTFKGEAIRQVQNFTNQCNKIQSHFQGLHIQDGALASYYQKLDACANKGMVLKRNIKDYEINVTEIYNLALGQPGNETINFTAHDTYSIKELVDTESNMLTIQALEYSRWEMAIHACASQLIPPSLVTPANLTEALNSISDAASAQGHKLSIPITQMGNYLKLPLADCAFTDAGNFVVRILVPIRKAVASPRLFRLHSIPFLLKDNKGAYSVCRMADVENHRVDDVASGYIAESECDPGDLCLLEDVSRSIQVSMCEGMLVKPHGSFASKVDAVNKFCQFECDKFDVNDTLADIEFPIVKRIAPNRIIVVGPPNLTIKIRCIGKMEQAVKLPELGALDIGLGCDCAVLYQDRGDAYPAEHPCEAETKISIRLPLHFFNEKFLKSGKIFGGVFTDEMKAKELFEPAEVEATGANVDDIDEGAISKNIAIVCLWVVLLVQTVVFGGVIFYLFKKIDGSMWEHKRFENKVVEVSSNNGAGARRVEQQSGEGTDARIVARNNYDMNVFT